MKVVIATPLYPPEVGGPSAYAKQFAEGFPKRGIETTTISFSSVRHLPSGVRHFVYFWRICRALRHAEIVFALDTWSVGIPARLAAWILRKKFVVRIGGDFLWESYMDHTDTPMILSEFYINKPTLSLKEQCIFVGTRWLLQSAQVLIFNTAWQRDIWQSAYSFDITRAHILENYYPAERSTEPFSGKVFVSAGRPRRLKNTKTLQIAFDMVKQKYPDIELDMRLLPPKEHQKRIQNAYAVVIPSVSEVCPNMAIDAIHYNKPFILPKDSGLHNRLGEIGIFVDTLEAKELAKAMEKLLDSAEYERSVTRVQSFSFVHTWDNILDEVSALLS